MADRDVKVTYKSRVLPRDYDGPDSNRPSRIATALDPYSHPHEAGALSRVRSARDRSSTTSIDCEGSLTAVDQGRSTYAHSSPGDTDRHFSRRDREAHVTELRHGRGRPNDFVLDNTIRKENNAYIMDARGEVEIVMPGRDRVQDRAPRYTYTYASPTQRRQYESSPRRRADDHDDRPAPEVVMLRRDITPPRLSRRDRPSSDDDWRLVDRMSTTRISTTTLPDPSSDRPRRRDQTQSSEDSYILVSPTSSIPSQPKSNLTRRSSMRRTSYSPATLSRRRSRSISFRDTQVLDHDCSERRHERPGAEAVSYGSHLRHYSSDDGYDGGGPRSRSRRRRGDRDTGRETKTVTTRYYQDDEGGEEEAYPPQRGPRDQRRRSRSRKGGRDRYDDDGDRDRHARDDESYVSERRTYTKKTTYR